MTTTELGIILRRRYQQAAPRKQAVEVVLFGIEYAETLRTCSIAEVCAEADIGKWGPQISLGVNLSERVIHKK
jgi:hypothetical protein